MKLLNFVVSTIKQRIFRVRKWHQSRFAIHRPSRKTHQVMDKNNDQLQLLLKNAVEIGFLHSPVFSDSPYVCWLAENRRTAKPLRTISEKPGKSAATIILPVHEWLSQASRAIYPLHNPAVYEHIFGAFSHKFNGNLSSTFLQILLPFVHFFQSAFWSRKTSISFPTFAVSILCVEGLWEDFFFFLAVKKTSPEWKENWRKSDFSERLFSGNRWLRKSLTFKTWL